MSITTPDDDLLAALGEESIFHKTTEDEVDKITDATFDVQEVQSLAKNDLDFLAALAMPSVYEYAFPPMFLAAWMLLTEYSHKIRDFSKLALGLPRGFSKTTFVKLFVLYCILFTDKKFILICSTTEKHAINIISDITDMLNEPNIINVFGDWKIAIETDTQALKKFSFRGRAIIIAGVGEGGSIRGFNLKNNRPDVMVFDDIQKREEADNENLAKALETWMYGTAMKAKNPKGCLYIFTANMYPTQWSLLRRIKRNQTWIKFIVGGILADGTSLWEALMPIKQLIEEFKGDLAAGHPEIFQAEVLNDENATLNNLIDIDKIPLWPYDAGCGHQGNFVVIDPAGEKIKSDATSIGYFEVYDSFPALIKVSEGRMSPMDTIKCALRYCLFSGARLVVIEGNAYQESLCYWFEFVCAQMGISGIQAVPIFSGTRAKNTRIVDMFKVLLTGETRIHPDVYSAVTNQLSSWNPLKKDNIDGILDLLTYAPRVIVEYPELVAITDILQSQEYAGASVRTVEENSSF